MKRGSHIAPTALIDEIREIKLPRDYPWKLLGKVAGDLLQFLKLCDQKTILRIIRLRDVQGYIALSEAWGLQSMRLVPDAPLVELRAKYQIASLLKKFIFPGSASSRRKLAIKKFLKSESDCLAFNNLGYKQLAMGDGDGVTNVYTYARRFIRRVLTDAVPGEEVMTKRSRHGPGANLDTQYGFGSKYFKYESWPYSCTADAFQEGRLLIQSDQRWLSALFESYRKRMNIPMHMPIDITQFWLSVIRIVPGNRISFVPKTSVIDRSIAIEPSLNLMLQLGVDGYIRHRLKRWGVDLDSQEKNQRLARIGSINPERFCTLDLAGASDGVSLKICQMLLPPDWYSYLMKLRSPVGDLDGEVISYEKISSMGNGFTFALETLIFTSIVYGVSMEVAGKFDRDEVAVYGDDIIVPRSHAFFVADMLVLSGFAINFEKSCFYGHVRESCGADWFKGNAVRPVFLTKTPEHVGNLFIEHNRLKRIFQLRFGIEEAACVTQLFHWIPEKFQRVRGPLCDTTFDAWIHTTDRSYGSTSNWITRHPALQFRFDKRKGPGEFHIRKLMHDLACSSDPIQKWETPHWKGQRLTAAGSRFAILDEMSVIATLTHSPALFWQDEYTEQSA